MIETLERRILRLTGEVDDMRLDLSARDTEVESSRLRSTALREERDTLRMDAKTSDDAGKRRGIAPAGSGAKTRAPGEKACSGSCGKSRYRNTPAMARAGTGPHAHRACIWHRPCSAGHGNYPSRARSRQPLRRRRQPPPSWKFQQTMKSRCNP